MAVRNTSDLIEFPGMGNRAPLVRLCNFRTGSADLTAAHAAWLRQHLVPLAESRAVSIRLCGYASKRGGAGANVQLSHNRAAAVQNFLETQLGQSLGCVEIGGYGESCAGGGQNNNSPVYRAVDVWVWREAVARPPVQPPDVSSLTTKLYFGIGLKVGGFLIIGGTQTLEGYLYSADDYNDRAWVEVRIKSLGVGLGGGGNVVLMLAYGASAKKQFVGLELDGWDFNASLGGRWGDFIKTATRLRAFDRIAKVIKDGSKRGIALKHVPKLKPEEWERIADLIKTLREALEVDANATKPELNVFDVPLAGYGLEVSFCKWWGEVTAFE